MDVEVFYASCFYFVIPSFFCLSLPLSSKQRASHVHSACILNNAMTFHTHTHTHTHTTHTHTLTHTHTHQLTHPSYPCCTHAHARKPPTKASPSAEPKVKVSRAFMPTSVIRKMGTTTGRGGAGRGRGRGIGGRNAAPSQATSRGNSPAAAAAAATGASGPPAPVDTQALSASQANIMRLFGAGFQ